MFDRDNQSSMAPMLGMATAVLGFFVITYVRRAIVYFFEIPPESTTDRWLIGILFVLLGLTIWAAMTLPFRSVRGVFSHGSARFADAHEIAPMVNLDGPVLGRDVATGKLLHYPGAGHLLTMAPTRTGKGVGTVIPNLLKVTGPIICIDPKGENVAATAAHRRQFGPVHVLDPFGITDSPTVAFNPLAQLDPHDVDLAEQVGQLAEALVHDAPGQVAEAHWNNEATALIAGVLLYVVTTESLEHRNLATLRDYLTQSPENFAVLLKAMQDSEAAHGLVRRAANRHLGKADREAAGVLSSAQRHTHFLDSPRMTAVMAQSDFTFTDLKTQNATVYLVLPPDRLATYARWLRLMVVESLQALSRGPSPARPILYLLDEFAALGYLAPIEQAMGLMAGYGVQLWPILQDIHQLRATYGKRADTFLANAGVLQVFGVNDQETAKLVSDLLGQQTVQFETYSASQSDKSSGSSITQNLTGRALMTPDEVRTLQGDCQLLFLQGMRPVLAHKIRYYADRDFAS